MDVGQASRLPIHLAIKSATIFEFSLPDGVTVAQGILVPFV
jgi:hypothetical protein